MNTSLGRGKTRHFHASVGTARKVLRTLVLNVLTPQYPQVQVSSIWIFHFNSLTTKILQEIKRTGKEILTRVVRKKVNAMTASHSSALTFFLWVQCC